MLQRKQVNALAAKCLTCALEVFHDVDAHLSLTGSPSSS
jgi:hypothetical protein